MLLSALFFLYSRVFELRFLNAFDFAYFEKTIREF